MCLLSCPTAWSNVGNQKHWNAMWLPFNCIQVKPIPFVPSCQHASPKPTINPSPPARTSHTARLNRLTPCLEVHLRDGRRQLHAGVEAAYQGLRQSRATACASASVSRRVWANRTTNWRSSQELCFEDANSVGVPVYQYILRLAIPSSRTQAARTMRCNPSGFEANQSEP